MISPPWYEGPVEELAFNLYAMNESAIQTVARILAESSYQQCADASYVSAVFRQVGLDITPENAERVQGYMDSYLLR